MKKRRVSSEKSKITEREHRQGYKTKRGFRIVKSPQYKLYQFIVDHFKGNLSSASRFIGISRSRFNTLVNRGIFSKERADLIVESLSKIDPKVTYESLFIPDRIEKVEKKKPLILPDPIRPTAGGYEILPKTKFSEILGKYK